MPRHKVLQVGENLGISLPRSLVREWGWCKGDTIFMFAKGGDIVLRNDTQRTARFSHTPQRRRDERVAIDAR